MAAICALRATALIKTHSISRCAQRLFSEKRKVERVKEWRKKKLQDPHASKGIQTPSEIEDLRDDQGVGALLNGIVIERQGDRLLVEVTDQTVNTTEHEHEEEERFVVCSQKKSSLVNANIVVGDRIQFRRIIASGSSSSSEGVAVSFKERRNMLERPVSSNANSLQMKQIAANIDQMVIVTCCQPVVPLVSIDRYLVIATQLNMTALIVLNKNDLNCSAEFYHYLSHYPSLGYNILKVSNSGEGIPLLQSHLVNKTSIFVGQSGVGKSSLINLILPEANIRTGGLTQKVQMGSHTTSNARLHHLSSGGDLIDSPGIREFGLWHLDRASIEEGFTEIHAASKLCKFRNCKHSEAELGCAVRARYNAGLINRYRLKHYFELTS